MSRRYIRVAYGKYDFAVKGGAVSTITLDGRGRNRIPKGAIILGGTIDIQTQLLSGGSATIALGLSAGAASDALKAATAVASWTVGQLALVPVFSAATMVKTTADGAITLTIAVADLTAGVLDVHLVYVVP